MLASELRFHGLIWDVRADTVDLDGSGRGVVREWLAHPGAVAIVAVDEAGRVLLQRQYRHPVGSFLWEVPAGLLDVDGEQPLAAARRELLEEAGLTAVRWDVLVDFYTTPGGSDEAVRCYLARGLTAVAEHDRPEVTDEEVGMVAAWVPLGDARDLVLAGALHNPSAVAGVLAAAAAADRGWTGLRAADAPWPERTSRSRGGGPGRH